MGSPSYGKMPHIGQAAYGYFVVGFALPISVKSCASAQNVVHDQRLDGDQKGGEPSIQQNSEDICGCHMRTSGRSISFCFFENYVLS